MIIKVPVSEVTVGERTEDSIVNMRRDTLFGRITLAKAKKMYPFDTVISVDRHYAKYVVADEAVQALIEKAAK